MRKTDFPPRQIWMSEEMYDIYCATWILSNSLETLMREPNVLGWRKVSRALWHITAVL